MKQIYCAICGNNRNTKVLYESNIDSGKVDEKIFSARRVPDRLHYRLHQCLNCTLIFSSPIFENSKIIELYKRSKFTYGDQTPYLGKTYVSYFEKFSPGLSGDAKILDVGCGNGFFLNELYKLGIKNVYGIEPSEDAAGLAPGYLRKKIKKDILREKSYPNAFFDIVSCFQTLDHIVDPNKFIQIIHRILKTKGKAIFVVHDTEGLSVKLFGERSPIFDIEHIYLFNKRSLTKIFLENGFKKVKIFSVRNTYPLSYWFSMVPWAAIFKKFLKGSPIGKIPVTLAAGNIGAVANK